MGDPRTGHLSKTGEQDTHPLSVNHAPYIESVYAGLIDELAGALAVGDAGPILVPAGRGLGKSTLLRAVARTLVQRHGLEAQLVEGRRMAYENGRWLETVRSDILLFDDVDIYLGIYTHADFEDVSARIGQIRRLFERRADAPAGAKRILATATSDLVDVPWQYAADPVEGARRQAIWALCLDEFRRPVLSLSPWSENWQENLAAVLRGAAPEVPLSELTRWGAAIEAVTGGHPALVEQSIEELRALVARSPRPATDSVEALERMLTARLRQRAKGLRPIRRALQMVELHEGDVGRQALTRLRAFANDSVASLWDDMPYDAVHLLERHGLLVCDPSRVDGGWRIPGALVRRAVMEHRLQPVAAPASAGDESSTAPRAPGAYPANVEPGQVVTILPAAPAPRDAGPDDGEDITVIPTTGGAGRIEIRPDEYLPHSLGKVRYFGPGRPQTLVLRDGMWQLVWILHKNAGSVVSYEVIASSDDADFSNEKQVRNAKTRLQQRLEEHGFPSIVETVYGKGLRLASRPG